MGKPCRDQELLSRRLAQLDCKMLAVTGGRSPQIHNGIEDPPSQNTHELGLRERPNLEVEPANRSGGARPRLVILDEFVIDPGSDELGPHVCCSKIAASVRDAPRADQLYAVDREGLDLEVHCFQTRRMIADRAVSRLSCNFLPRATASSSLARPLGLKYSFSGTSVMPSRSTAPLSLLISRLWSRSLRGRRGRRLKRLCWRYSGM